MLEESITRYGLGRGIVVDKHGVVIAGNKTHEVALERGLVKTRIVKTRGDELVVTQREDLDLSDPDPSNPARMLAYADNRVSEVSLEWNAEIVKDDVGNGLDLAPFFFEHELKALMGITDESGERASLADRFGVPPFSVLDARQGYWQDRKRAWLTLGIESELGRGGGVNTVSSHALELAGGFQNHPAHNTMNLEGADRRT